MQKLGTIANNDRI